MDKGDMALTMAKKELRKRIKSILTNIPPENIAKQSKCGKPSELEKPLTVLSKCRFEMLVLATRI